MNFVTLKEGGAKESVAAIVQIKTILFMKSLSESVGSEW